MKEVGDIIPSHTVADDEVNITRETYRAPKASNSLAKFMAMDEPEMLAKGKAKLEVPNFEEISVDNLHQQYLIRLPESRDAEINMVNTLKRKYEVRNTPLFPILYILM